MKRLFCLALLLCVAAVLVQSETKIEVDENGDEYEVKRFYIEGRQLNGGRRQCVETRRRRSNSEFGRNEATDEDTAKKGFSLPKGTEISPTTPVSGVDTETSDSGVDAGNEEGFIGMVNDETEKADADSDDDDDGDNDDEDGDDDDDDELYYQVPLVVQQHKQSTSALHHSAAAVAAGPNGVVVVQTDEPPKVNPETHAVFQVLPISQSIAQDGEFDEDGQLLYEEEISPVSTTAIWSTGDNDDDLDLDLDGDIDADYVVDEGSSKPKPKPKPTKGKKKPPKRGNKNKSHKKKSNKKVKRRRPGKENRRRLPGKRRQGNNNKRRRRPSGNGSKVHRYHKNANRRLNADLSNRDVNRKKLNKLNKVDQGSRTYTKTETMTQTGTSNDDKDLNCIIIRKEPPTTQRPFWNIFGRDANNEGNAAVAGEGEGEKAIEGSANGHRGQFGKRKRVNMRLIP